MQPRVTAILVAHSGAAFLERTLAALASQTRRPDVTIAVDVASSDNTEALLSASGPTHLLSVRGGTTFGAAITSAVQLASPPESDNEWLWLLRHDSAPAPTALAQLLGAVEIAPSVVVAGPKLMRWDEPRTIAAFGQTLSTLGASISLVENELDQAQHDTQDDVLGVAAAGMLVRRSVWVTLGGFDPGLPSIDASLDFSVRARLAGYRVVLVPGARILSAGGPELFARKSITDRRRFRLARSAQLHRRLVYSAGSTLVIHWLSLVPLAIVRAFGDLLAKRPGQVAGEFSAAFSAAFTGNVGAARSNLRRTRKLGWAALAGLRMPTGMVIERRAQAREAQRADLDPVRLRGGIAGGGDRSWAADPQNRAGFVVNGGLWAVLLIAVVGVLAYSGLGASSAVSGGGLLPLSGTVPELWSQLGFGWREIGVGFLGAADPFVAVLAVLGSITFWAPSLSIVLLYLCALPLAALGAWFAARRISSSPWMPTLAAVLWAFAPPLLSGLVAGHLGAMIAHLVLPWLFLAAMSAGRSWAAGASAALLFAVVAASAPSLVPALLVLWVIMVAVRPRGIHRVIGIPLPAALLFAPLIVQQLLRGNPLGLLADPGVPSGDATGSGWHLALSDSTGSLLGWPVVLNGFAVPSGAGPVLVAALLAPVGILALLALFLPGSRRAVPAMVVAGLGYLTAVGATHLQLTAVGSDAVSVWPGSGLSLYWLGLTGAVVIGVPALRKAAAPLAIVSGLTVTALAIPLLGGLIVGAPDVGTAIKPTTDRILPALVTAEARTHPRVGTLMISVLGSQGISVSLQRGLGATLDDQSTLASTKTSFDATEKLLATLAGNLTSRSGYDEGTVMREHDIRFIVLAPGSDDNVNYRRTVEALNANDVLTPIGTTANGLLWRYEGETTAVATGPTNTGTPLGRWILIGFGIVFGITALLAIPTEGRRRPRRTAAVAGDPSRTIDDAAFDDDGFDDDVFDDDVFDSDVRGSDRVPSADGARDSHD